MTLSDPSKSTAPKPPHFVVYSDLWVGTQPPNPSSLKGFNVFNLSFLLLKGAWDNAKAWESLTDVDRSTIKAKYKAAGIKLMVSAFGSTDLPTTSRADPVSTANTMAEWVKKYQLDGIDVDYEDLDAFNAGDGSAENWLITFTKQLRKELPVGQYIVTHARKHFWFSPKRWGGGGYLKVNSEVGNLIDWYNIQFYNQGANEYTTPQGLLTTSSSTWPDTAVFQIHASGVPLSKIVIGKPGTPGDAATGYMGPSILASCLAQAKKSKWSKYRS
ncbi:glycoside hydrolase [Amanita rubescens]|nr:glycoside hydrolase [Amanita rubescens]